MVVVFCYYIVKDLVLDVFLKEVKFVVLVIRDYGICCKIVSINGEGMDNIFVFFWILFVF